MKLIDLSVEGFIEEVDSNSPAPGGGSLAALAGALGSGLSRMVGHLSIGKKKFKNLTEEQQKEFKDALKELDSIKKELMILIDEDTNAFNLIMKAFKLPKETEEEKAVRRKAINNATIKAIEVPLAVARVSKKGMDFLPVIRKYGNKNCLSDVGVSMLLLHSAFVGAVMNVKINISGLSLEQGRNYTDILEKLQEDTDDLARNFTKDILHSL